MAMLDFNNFLFFFQLHVNSKPPYSFSCLIFMAIEDSHARALPVKEIYSWITDHFPYFIKAPTGWKNSVRHNLSLNKCFRKVDKAPVCIVKRGRNIFRAQMKFFGFFFRILAKAHCGS